MVLRSSADSGTVAPLVLSEILAKGLYGHDEPAAVAESVLAVNFRLAEVALYYGADRAWQLVPCGPPTRQ
jgi:hypothetical protein